MAAESTTFDSILKVYAREGTVPHFFHLCLGEERNPKLTSWAEKRLTVCRKDRSFILCCKYQDKDNTTQIRFWVWDHIGKSIKFFSASSDTPNWPQIQKFLVKKSIRFLPIDEPAENEPALE